MCVGVNVCRCEIVQRTGMELIAPVVLNPVHPPESSSQHRDQDPFHDSTLPRVKNLVQILAFFTVVTSVTFLTIVTVTTTVLAPTPHRNPIIPRQKTRRRRNINPWTSDIGVQIEILIF